MLGECRCWGYEISPQAFGLSHRLSSETLQFKLADIRQEDDAHFDLMLLMDVIEHLEDYFGFLRELQPKAEYKSTRYSTFRWILRCGPSCWAS